MTKQPLPRFTTTISFEIDVAASSRDEALERIDAITEFVQNRMTRSTFERLPGRPVADMFGWTEPELHGYDIDRGITLDANGVGVRAS